MDSRYLTMAKSVHEKKKRIARITSLENHEYQNIVSSITNETDNNRQSMFSNKFETDLFESLKNVSKRKAQNAEILNAKQKCISIRNPKKLGLSRKFPLMEKSQRALKQIHHNRKIPKPRAHLAGLSDSPLINNNLVPIEKSKTINVKEKHTAKVQNKKITNKSVHRNKTASENERNKKFIEEPERKITFNKMKPGVMNKNKIFEEFCNLLNDSNWESGNSSSDAEFERFIQNEKKGLPKTQKSIKKRSRSVSKRVSKKSACTKDISRPVGKEKYSDMNDELPKPIERIKNKRKLLRNRQSRISVEKNTYSETDVCNEKYHDSSSESDEVGLTSANDSCGSQLYGQEGFKSKSVPPLNSHLQETAVSSLVINNQSSIVHKTHMVSLESNDQPRIPHTISLMDNNQPTVLFNATYSLLVNNQPNIKHKVFDVSSVANNIHSSISNKTHITSLERNDQSNIPRAVSLMDKNQPTVLFNACHSLLVSNQPNRMYKVCDVSSLANNSQSSIVNKTHITSLESNDQPNIPHAVSLMTDNSQPHTIVKSESFGVCGIIKSGPVSVSSSPKKSDQSLLIDLAESDDECANTFTITPKNIAVSGPNQNELPSHSDESEVEIVNVVVHDLPQESKKKNSPQSSKNILIKTQPVSQTVKSTSILNKTVKNEPCDDCEIIFDAASTSSVTKMTNIRKCSNSDIKNKDFENLALSTSVPNKGSFAPEKNNKLAQKEERLHEVACSNLRNITNIQKSMEPLEKKRVGDLQSVASSLETLKKEVSTYKEIKLVEQSVEATFKLLERQQAEKLILLKSQIAQHLNSSGIVNNCNAIKNVMPSQLDTQVSSCKSLKDSNQDVSLKSCISVEDLKNFAAINIVPLSSIPAEDIKPDVSQLQCTSKTVDRVTYETNNMSLYGKCIVCAKDASSACQCAKVFFCSNECGVKYWENGHKNTCVKDK